MNMLTSAGSKASFAIAITFILASIEACSPRPDDSMTVRYQSFHASGFHVDFAISGLGPKKSIYSQAKLLWNQYRIDAPDYTRTPRADGGYETITISMNGKDAFLYLDRGMLSTMVGDESEKDRYETDFKSLRKAILHIQDDIETESMP